MLAIFVILDSILDSDFCKYSILFLSLTTNSSTFLSDFRVSPIYVLAVSGMGN
jgi:hypothetical protein